MNNKLLGGLFFLCLMLFSCSVKQDVNIASPDSNIQLSFTLDNTGKPHYEVFFKNKKRPSKINLTIF